MKQIINCIILYSLTFLTSCGDKNTPDYCQDGYDTRMKIVNNADYSIYVYTSVLYPDTNSYKLFSNIEASMTRGGKTEAHSTKSTFIPCTLEAFFKNHVKSDTLMVFFIKDEGQGEDHLKDHHTVLKRYDLTLQELENKNWTITYP